MALLLALAALCLGGCGGGGSSQSQGSSEQSTARSAPKEQNAEASIEGFGSEAAGSEREEVLAAFHGYLGALADGDEQKACSYLAARVGESLQQLAAKAKKAPSCPELLEALPSPQPDRIAKGQDEGKIAKVRVKGDTAFVVFHAPGARLYQLAMVEEEGRWKATSLSASVLAPTLNPR